MTTYWLAVIVLIKRNNDVVFETMSNLNSIEKRAFEDLFGMETGYVLEFSNRTFSEFFRDTVQIDIYNEKYAVYGNSKAQRLRAFWDIETRELLGKTLLGLLETWEYEQEGEIGENRKYRKCLEAASNLAGKPINGTNNNVEFMDRSIELPDLALLQMDGSVTRIIDERLKEIELGLNSGASLSVVFLCGSILEGVLLDTAIRNAETFNRSSCSPKDKDGKVLQFHKWSLAQYIDVACDVDLLQLDVKKFSHALRDFRNYIHPYEQMASQFSPDKHTADICFQVLKAALADLSKQR